MRQHIGPASTQVKSTTRMPSRGLPAEYGPERFAWVLGPSALVAPHPRTMSSTGVDVAAGASGSDEGVPPNTA